MEPVEPQTTEVIEEKLEHRRSRKNLQVFAGLGGGLLVAGLVVLLLFLQQHARRDPSSMLSLDDLTQQIYDLQEREREKNKASQLRDDSLLMRKDSESETESRFEGLLDQIEKNRMEKTALIYNEHPPVTLYEGEMRPCSPFTIRPRLPRFAAANCGRSSTMWFGDCWLRSENAAAHQGPRGCRRRNSPGTSQLERKPDAFVSRCQVAALNSSHRRATDQCHPERETQYV
jgi:hypothetical protein